MSSAAPDDAPRFAERPSTPFVPEGLAFAAVPLGGAVLAGAAGAPWLAWPLAALSAFVLFFFRNPARVAPGGASCVVAAADGRVLEAGAAELADGTKGLRVAVFLSLFDVHVNRAPVAGRVVSVERSGGRYRAAFDPRAEGENARCALELETPGGARVRVVQIAGLVARRIVCHPRPGEWLGRGDRYGLIRFGSRTDVLLPPDAELRVARGQRVRGGRSVIAVLAPPARDGAAPP